MLSKIVSSIFDNMLSLYNTIEIVQTFVIEFSEDFLPLLIIFPGESQAMKTVRLTGPGMITKCVSEYLMTPMMENEGLNCIVIIWHFLLIVVILFYNQTPMILCIASLQWLCLW
jgi:hypothetical protein